MSKATLGIPPEIGRSQGAARLFGKTGRDSELADSSEAPLCIDRCLSGPYVRCL